MSLTQAPTKQRMDRYMHSLHKKLTGLLKRVQTEQPTLNRQNELITLVSGTATMPSRCEVRTEYHLLDFRGTKAIGIITLGKDVSFGIFSLKERTCYRLTAADLVLVFKESTDVRAQYDLASYVVEQLTLLLDP